MQSKQKSVVTAVAVKVFRNSLLANRYMTPVIRMPNRALIKRQPKGVMPKSRIPGNQDLTKMQDELFRRLLNDG